MNPFEAVLLLVLSADPFELAQRVLLTGVLALSPVYINWLRTDKILTNGYAKFAVLLTATGALLVVWTVPL